MSWKISVFLVGWYKINRRNLPWRHSTDAYLIWISEVILQQTRVAQGLPYFYKFIEQYPNVSALASANEQEVLRLWQGLGYYSRARNMHKTAQQVVRELHGIFPDSFQELIKLKGIGDYTASAVASFSSNEKVAVLDGNVMRVLCRVYGLEDDIALPKTKVNLKLIAEKILPEQNADIHNQAIMEFGALQCVPVKPLCQDCILNGLCEAFKSGKQHILPIKSKKPSVRVRHFNYFIFTEENKIYVKRRNKGDIWEGLFDFYLIETNKEVEGFNDYAGLVADESIITNGVILYTSGVYKHILTHQKLLAKFFIIKVKNLPVYFLNENNLILLKIEEVLQLPKPVLISNFIDNQLIKLKL